MTGGNKISQEAQQNFNCTLSKPVSGRTQAVTNTSVTSSYNSPNNFPTKFLSDNNTITKIQAPAIKTNGQVNGTTRVQRNLNNNVASTADLDFVADFSTAVIFNGATLNNNNNNNNSSSKITKTDSSYSTAQNGTNLNENANFADFEHNPIFNAGIWCFVEFI